MVMLFYLAIKTEGIFLSGNRMVCGSLFATLAETLEAVIQHKALVQGGGENTWRLALLGRFRPSQATRMGSLRSNPRSGGNGPAGGCHRVLGQRF